MIGAPGLKHWPDPLQSPGCNPWWRAERNSDVIGFAKTIVPVRRGPTLARQPRDKLAHIADPEVDPPDATAG